MLANGLEPRDEKEGEEWNRQQLQRIDLRWHDLRHEGACRLHADGVDIRIIQLMLGHASIQQTQRVLERDGRRTAERSGGELEESRTTASAGFVRQLMQSLRVARLSRFCPGESERLAPQAGFEPATLRLMSGSIEMPGNISIVFCLSFLTLPRKKAGSHLGAIYACRAGVSADARHPATSSRIRAAFLGPMPRT